MRRVLSLVAMALVCAAGAAATVPARAQNQARVRVGLLLSQEMVTIGADGPLDALDVESGRREALEGGRIMVRPVAAGVEVAGVTFGDTVRLQPRAGVLQVNGRAYRGVLELRRTAQGRVTAINDVDLEEYLYGVVRSEMDPRWPPEALRAQAIAARSLAAQSVGRSAAEGYDLRATTDSQVYGGVAAEDSRTTTAVEATRGVVILSDGRPVFAAFHADSGGATESSEHVWGSVVPHLRGVQDPFSREAPNHRWTARVEFATIEAHLQRAGRPVAGLQRVEVIATSPSGRAAHVRLTAGSGVVEMRGVEFRAALGLATVRSTLFTIRPAGEGTIEIAGRGSGHGVGMSQWGARGQALAGRDYTEILRYYYTGVAIGSRQ